MYNKTELKNPFALRNNEIVTINDIHKEEKGLKCNCVCPKCKEPLLAKLGDVNIHHFSHSSNTKCNETNSYINALYLLLNEYLKNHKLYLPEIKVGYNLINYPPITYDNVASRVYLIQNHSYDRTIRIYKSCTCKFDKYEIIQDDEVPEALIVTKCGDNNIEHKLAIVITPPRTVCITFKGKSYKEYNTLQIDLSNKLDMIQSSTKSELLENLFKDTSLYSWLSNSKIKRAYPKIIENSEKYQLCLEEKQRQQ